MLAAPENGVSQVEDGAGRFPQMVGMSFVFDKAQPAGSRVSDVMVAGVPLDPAKRSGMVSDNDMRGGGDGWQAACDFGPDPVGVTAEYLAANAPYRPVTGGRITVKQAAGK